MSDVPRDPRGPETVDDDQLAAALAAEMQRYTPTGSLRVPPPAAQGPAGTGRPPSARRPRTAPPADVAAAPTEPGTDTGSTRRAAIAAEREAARSDRARALEPEPAPQTSLLRRLTEGPHPFTPPDATPVAPPHDLDRPHGRRARRPGEPTGPITGPLGTRTGPVATPDTALTAAVGTAPTILPAGERPAGDLTATGPQPTVLPAFEPDRHGAPVGPTTGEVRIVRMTAVEDDDEGVDDVVIGVPAVAASTAAIALPPMVEVTPSAVVGSGTGSVAVVASRVPPAAPRASAVAWAGVFASPLTALLGFALAGAGAGGAAPVLMVAAVALTVPAIVRTVRRAAERQGGLVVVARDAFGATAGSAVAAVVLLSRLLVLVLVLLGTADLAAAYGARTGAIGDGTVPAVAAVLVPAIVAAVVGLLPGGVARVVQVVLGAFGLAAFLLAALLVASAGGGTAASGPGDVIATVVALGFVGLVTAATGADLVGRARGFGTPLRAAVSVACAAAVGLVLLVLALVAGASAASAGDPLDGFAGALADATSQSLALPVALSLLAGLTSMPTVLAASLGRASADLLPGGRSPRLGAAAAALLAAAVALGVVAAGGSVGGALGVIAPVAGVLLAAWSGALTAAPLIASASADAVRARGLLVVGTLLAVVVGLLLADGVGAPAERSPLLQLAGVAPDAPIRAGSAAALIVVWVLAVAAGLVARFAGAQRAGVPADAAVTAT